MSFLQPYILWALPLVLVPILIHLINRLRHRRQPWAAMRFLVSATRSSISHARLRQFLVLLFRVLAVLMLILFLSRPLAGGWLGWALSPAPDAIVLLLDRSASMETKLPGSTATRREQAVKLLAESARSFQGASHVILIDSALRTPQEVANVSTLAELSLTAPTDTAADLPAMMQTAMQWLIENRAGTAEIWIASDLQQSNWLPSDSRWKNVTSQLASLPQKVRVRLLAFDQNTEANGSISLKEMVRRQRAEAGELQWAVDVQHKIAVKESIPLTMTLDGVPSQHEIGMEGQSLRWRSKATLGARKTGGWGSFSVPADANGRDNTAYFVYGSDTPLRASIVSADSASGRYFQLAADVVTGPGGLTSRVIPPLAAAGADWSDSTLLVWQGPLPSESIAARMRAFAQEGGAVIFFPPGPNESLGLHGVTWGESQLAEADGSFRVVRWDENQGPLAKTDEGITLPVTQLVFARRQPVLAPAGSLAVLAAFDDGATFLARQTLGNGEIYFCASLPHREWSTLGQGPVLVPMFQRLLQMGSRRLQQASFVSCGELAPAEQAKPWMAVDSTTSKDIRLQGGIYRAGERLVAVNRPAAEDEWEVLEASRARQLFGALPFQMLEERRVSSDALQGEIWRMLLFGMLIFLLVEALLVLPPRTAAGGQGQDGKTETGPGRALAEVSP